MALDDTKWTIDRATGNIRYTGDDHGGAAPAYATVLEFHRWLQNRADDAEFSGASGDELDIISTNPSGRSTDNYITLLGSYNIDDYSSEFLYDGSIVQGTGGSEVIYDGVVNFGNADVQIQLIQNGAVLTDDFWNNGGAGINADATQGISHRFLIKVRSAGADIDGRRLIGTCRRFGYSYSEFKINGTARGNNVLALSDSTDLNNQTAAGTVATWTAITNTTEGYANIDVNNDGTDEYFYSEWNRDAYTINQFYERQKWLTREGSASTLYGLNGELFRGITHQIAVSSGSGTWSTAESLSWSGGTGQMLAVDNTAGASVTALWLQLLTGVAPTNTQVITGGTSGATATASGTATERAISTPVCGQSTGNAIIGAYGFGVEYADLAAADTLFDLAANPFNPPNNVTFTVSGLISTEDRVLVGPWDGTTTDADGNPEIDYNQLSNNALLSSATTTSVVVSTSIPSDTPNTGTIRVETDSGAYKLCSYTSWTGSTFTITSTDFSSDNAAATNNVFISYLDKVATGANESFTGVYNADRSLVIKVRDGGGTPIKEYISSGTLTSSGGSVTAIRTVDA